MKPVKNIIWDFGVVLVDLNFDLFHKKCRDYGIKSDIHILNTHFSYVFEKGLIDERTFFREVKLLFPGWVSISTIKEIWNSLIDHIPTKKLALLHKLKKRGLNQVLCSNTNLTHIQHIWEKHGPFTSAYFKKAFIKLYFSYEHQTRKPEPEFFYLILNEMNWKADETLLIDDNEQNISTANSLGLQVLHYTSPQSLIYFDKAQLKPHEHLSDEQNK